MKNLNLYMRAVAVVALIVVGGVGVYKGRSMLGSKDADPKATASAKDGKGKDSKDAPTTSKPKFVPKNSSTTSKTKPEIKKSDLAKPGSSLASASSSRRTSSGTSNKPASLGTKKFKFGSVGGKDEGDDTSAAAKPAAAKPNATALGSKPKPNNARASEYSLSDSPAAGETSDYSAAPAAPSTSDFSGYSGGSLSDDTTSQYGSPTEVAEATETAESPESTDTTAPPASDYAAAPPATTKFGTSDTADTGSQYSADTTLEPTPAAPAYGATGDTYAATPADDTAEPSPALAAPPSTLRSSRIPKNTMGSSAAGASTSPPPATTKFGASSPAATTKFGQPASATDRLADSASSLRSSLPPRSASTAPRYADDLTPSDSAYGSTDDITPIPAGTSSQLGTEIRPEMEGPQTPTIEVEKFAPPEVQVGKAALFEIVVKNVGRVPAYDVTVEDEVPAGTRLSQASPQPQRSKTGGLVWKLGTMKPGEEKIIELQLVPEAEGEIGSVAQVSFQAQAAAKSIVTRPKLEVRHDAPATIHAGENATVRLTITNSGTGAASGVLLQSDVPQGFTHPAGHELEFEVGTLRPGESKQVELVMKAEQAGQYENVFVVRGDGDVEVQDAAQIEIVAPSLQVAVAGPRKRFVERQATHTVTISNPGTAAAKEVDLVAYLPRGFKFVSADHQGQYDARQHAVVWGLEELPPGASGSVSLTTLPVEAGEQKLRVEGRSANGLTAEFEQMVAVDALAELIFTIADLADPIEVGSETTYEIRISNRGAKDATNVAVAVAFPPDLKPLEGDGAARGAVTGQQVDFAPIARLAPGSEVALKVRALGQRAGDHRIAVSLTSDEQREAVTREESTRVYSDQ